MPLNDQSNSRSWAANPILKSSFQSTATSNQLAPGPKASEATSIDGSPRNTVGEKNLMPAKAGEEMDVASSQEGKIMDSLLGDIRKDWEDEFRYHGTRLDFNSIRLKEKDSRIMITNLKVDIIELIFSMRVEQS